MQGDDLVGGGLEGRAHSVLRQLRQNALQGGESSFASCTATRSNQPTISEWSARCASGRPGWPRSRWPPAAGRSAGSGPTGRAWSCATGAARRSQLPGRSRSRTSAPKTEARPDPTSRSWAGPHTPWPGSGYFLTPCLPGVEVTDATGSRCTSVFRIMMSRSGSRGD
jgi:hypothetical protein